MRRFLVPGRLLKRSNSNLSGGAPATIRFTMVQVQLAQSSRHVPKRQVAALQCDGARLFHPDNYTNAPAEVRTKMVEAYRLVSESRPDA